MKTRIIALAFAAALMAASMTGCGLSEEGKHAQSLLNALPETYSAEIDAQLEEARAAYDALTDAQKAWVTKLAVLEAAELYWNTVHNKVSLVLTGADTVRAIDG